MGLDPEIAQELERVAAAGGPRMTDGSPDEGRRRYEAQQEERQGSGYTPAPVASVSEREIDGPRGPIAVRIYTPADAIAATVVYLHGGGWVIGGLDDHDSRCREMANATRAVLVSVDYRLAPEAPYPAPLDDAMAAVRWAAQTWPGHPLGVAGDSAGGGLSAGCALRARAEGVALAAQLLVYPALDPELSQPSVVENAEGYGLSSADMHWFYGHYLGGGAGSTDPEVNLLRADDLSGLAPAVVTVAEFDPLRDEGVLYAERLQAAGVRTTVLAGAGLVHGYMQMTGLSAAAAREAAAAHAAFARLLTS